MKFKLLGIGVMGAVGLALGPAAYAGNEGSGGGDEIGIHLYKVSKNIVNQIKRICLSQYDAGLFLAAAVENSKFVSAFLIPQDPEFCSDVNAYDAALVRMSVSVEAKTLPDSAPMATNNRRDAIQLDVSRWAMPISDLEALENRLILAAHELHSIMDKEASEAYQRSTQLIGWLKEHFVSLASLYGKPIPLPKLSFKGSAKVTSLYTEGDYKAEYFGKLQQVTRKESREILDPSTFEFNVYINDYRTIVDSYYLVCARARLLAKSRAFTACQKNRPAGGCYLLGYEIQEIDYEYDRQEYEENTFENQSMCHVSATVVGM